MHKRIVTILFLTGFASFIGTLPPEPKVTQGSASYILDHRSLTIESTDKAILDFPSFDISASESVNFQLPSDTSKVLSRIHDTKPSEVLGALSSNGELYLANPFGVYFGEQCVVDVASLVVAGAQIANDDFLNGKDLFTNPTGVIENHGRTQAKRFAAIASSFVNKGQIHSSDWVSIITPNSDVILKERGGYTYLKLSADNTGSEQEGLLSAGDTLGVALHYGSEVKAKSVLVDTDQSSLKAQGSIDVSSSDSIGGNVTLLGDKIDVAGGFIGASGDLGGGTIKVGGDYLGKASLPKSLETITDKNTRMVADAISSGNGGDIVIWSEKELTPNGRYSSKGGLQSGDGGYVETSGREGVNLIGEIEINTLAPEGKVGTWMVDPEYGEVYTQTGLNLKASTNLFLQFQNGARLMTFNDTAISLSEATNPSHGNLNPSPRQCIEFPLSVTILSSNKVAFGGEGHNGSQLSFSLKADEISINAKSIEIEDVTGRAYADVDADINRTYPGLNLWAQNDIRIETESIKSVSGASSAGINLIAESGGISIGANTFDLLDAGTSDVRMIFSAPSNLHLSKYQSQEPLELSSKKFVFIEPVYSTFH